MSHAEVEEDVILAVNCKGTPYKRMVRNKNEPVQQAVIRYRLISARIMSGLCAVEAATKLGYKNSTQLSLIESGERPIPKDWKWIINAAQVYSVSVDYILGLSPHPERDAIAAETFSLLDGFQDLMKIQAASMTAACIAASAQGKVSIEEMETLCTSVEAVKKAVDTMRDLSDFDEMRGGATVLATVARLQEAIVPIDKVARQRRADAPTFAKIAAGDLGKLAYLVVDTEMEAHQHEFE